MTSSSAQYRYFLNSFKLLLASIEDAPREENKNRRFKFD